MVGKSEIVYGNWVGCISYIKRNKTSWKEWGQTHTLIYFSFFYCSSNRDCSLISSSELSGARNFHLSLHRRGWFSIHNFTSSRLPADYLPNPVASLYPCGVRRMNVSVSSGCTPAQKFWNPLVSLLDILIIAIIHLWLADRQRFLWPVSLRNQLVVRRLFVFSSIFSLFLLPVKLASRSLPNFNSP